MTSGVFDAVHAFDQAFAGKDCHVVDPIGRAELLGVDQWRAEPDWVDRELFIEPCHGATIDIGCGPGRLVAELASRHIPALGIDISPEAVRQARLRGALAIRRDVFDSLPGHGRWEHALLADGNIGIGGDPVKLLERIGTMLAPDGEVIVEVEGEGVGITRELRQLRIEGRLSTPFEWALVGLDAIEMVADLAGLRAISTHSAAGRHTATLKRMVA